jgi:hypothetical protein
MTKYADVLSRLPELPIELFERSAKLDYSEHAPVITNRFEAITLEASTIPLPAVNRASHDIKLFFAWVLYPHVVCTPMPDPEAMARVKPQIGKSSAPRHAADLAAIAQKHSFFKLSRFRGEDLATPWGCDVRYGPWFGTITYIQSCDDGVPDRWALVSSVLSMEIEWEGDSDDMPSVPNLTVIWNSGDPAQVTVQCCPGHRWCPASGSCLPDQIDCPDLIPA